MRVHESQAYKKMDVTREHISHILAMRKMLLSFQNGFNLISAAVIYVILENISGLAPSSDTTDPRYLKLVTVSSFCLFTLISLLMVLFVISLAFSAQISMPKAVEALLRCSTNFTCSSSSPAKPLMSFSKVEIGDCSASNTHSAFMIF